MLHLGAFVMLALAVMFPSYCASSTNYPRAVWRAMGCMVDVLRTVPGVTSPHVGVMRTTPFVEYEWRGSKVDFLAYVEDSDSRRFAFQATLSGLSTPGSAPDDMGAGKITTLWDSRCQVNTSVLFE